MPRRDSDRGHREQAAYWAVRTTNEPDSLTTAELDEFHQFLADPRDAEEYHANCTILHMSSDIRGPERERLVASANPIAERRARWRPNLWAIAASLLAFLIAGGYLVYAQPWNRDVYTTRAGETREIRLHVGSVAYLNTRSELRKLEDDNDCRYEVVKGEVLFNIAPNAARPCRVLIGGSEIRVLGTQFNVLRKLDGHITVTVIDGVVEVRALAQGGGTADWARVLRANEQLEYRLLGLVREPHAVQADAAVGWREGLYRFDKESVANVITELSRYTDMPIIIRDPRVAEERISGGLRIRNVEDSIRSLEQLGPIRVREHNGVFAIEYSPETDPAKN